VIATAGKARAVDEMFPGLIIMNLGPIHNKQMPSFYSALDGLIIPSREDNFPNVIAESLTMGCPVIAFKTGGIPELITRGFNGLLSDEITPQGLASTVNQFVRRAAMFNREAIRKNMIESSQKSQSLEILLQHYRQSFKS
jgi:glycosyltransferase involved in cell wall biosynthesis